MVSYRPSLMKVTRGRDGSSAGEIGSDLVGGGAALHKRIRFSFSMLKKAFLKGRESSNHSPKGRLPSERTPFIIIAIRKKR